MQDRDFYDVPGALIRRAEREADYNTKRLTFPGILSGVY